MKYWSWKFENREKKEDVVLKNGRKRDDGKGEERKKGGRNREKKIETGEKGGKKDIVVQLVFHLLAVQIIKLQSFQEN